MRFFLVDRITKLELGKSIEGAKCWSLTDDFLNEHFPGFPIVPGVLLTESMAQLMGTLLEKSHLEQFPSEHGVYAVLSIARKVKFKKFVIPGDKMEMVGKLTSLDVTHGSGEISAYVDGVLRAEADLTFVLISKKHLPNPRLTQMRDEYFNIITQAQTLRDQAVL